MAINLDVLEDIYKELEEMKKRWCSSTIDDPEDMWQQIPEFLSHASVRMGRALELLPQPVLKIIGNKTSLPLESSVLLSTSKYAINLI